MNTGKLSNIFAAMLLTILCGCGHSEKSAHDHDSEKVTEEEHSHEGLIVLTPEQVKLLGVESEEVTPGKFADVLKVSGEITSMPGNEGVVAARQSGIVHIARGITPGVHVGAGATIATVSAKGMSGGDPNEAARVAYESARRELERITPLHKEGIVSTKDYNAALQRVEEARSTLGAGAARYGAATAPVAGTVTSVNVADGEFVSAGQPIATISSNKALTLRADLPESHASMARSITNARFHTPYSSGTTDVAASGGHRISASEIVKSADGYIPLYFSLPNTGAADVSGSFCEVYLIGAESDSVISVAEDALSEQQGKYFLYLEEMSGHYRKIPVTPGNTDGHRRQIISGLATGQKVVTKGMTYVKLAETSGVVPEGHSHNH